MRKVLGIVAGVVVAMLAITVVEAIGHRVYPPGAGSVRDAAAVAAYIAAAPVGAMAFIVAGWFLGALVGGWTAVRIARWATATWFVGALIALAGIYTATQVPAPLWMQLSTVLAPALGAFAALHLVRR